MYGLAMAKGLLVTLKNLTKKPFTVQYPEQRLQQHPRFRGEEFAWYEERCTGCASCAKYCPLCEEGDDSIVVLGGPSEISPSVGGEMSGLSDSRIPAFSLSCHRQDSRPTSCQSNGMPPLGSYPACSSWGR